MSQALSVCCAAGTIGAVGNNDVGLTGVSWRVNMIGCKFLYGPEGEGSDSDAIECIRWCVDQGAKVISNSWGSSSPRGPEYLQELTRVSMKLRTCDAEHCRISIINNF